MDIYRSSLECMISQGYSVDIYSGLPLTWIFPQNVEKPKIFITNVEKNVVFGDFYGKPWKFEIGVEEKTWILNFPLLRKNQPPFFVTNVAKTWFSVISMEKSWKFETRVK